MENDKPRFVRLEMFNDFVVVIANVEANRTEKSTSGLFVHHNSRENLAKQRVQ